jgi:hypothetical protein
MLEGNIMWIIILVVLTLVGLFLYFNNKKCVSLATNLTYTFIQRINNMEIGKLTWLPSTDSFVEKQQIMAAIDDARFTQLGADLSSSAESADLQFETGSSIVLFIRTIGDNGTQKDSSNLLLVAKNEQQVSAATNLGWQWLSHTD